MYMMIWKNDKILLNIYMKNDIHDINQNNCGIILIFLLFVNIP